MTDDAERRAVAGWIGEHAHPLATVDPSAPLTDLGPLPGMVGDAVVVALGGSTRGARELSLVKHRLVRLLVEELGFRSLSLEADRATCEPLDHYVRTGKGDPRDLLAGAQSFWRTEEMVDVFAWMRRHNEQHPDDPLRILGVDPDIDRPLENMATIERAHADNLGRWRDETGHKIAHWGGSGHIANATSGTAETDVVRRAGSYLRERLGAGYLAVGLTFSHGSAPYPVPAPSAALADSVLAAAASAAGLDGYALDLSDPSAPEPVRAWLRAPAMARLIGPRYDPDDDLAFHMAGGSLAEWFDVIVHWQEVTPIRPLPDSWRPRNVSD
jgi:erythromycin esterase